MKVSTAEFTGLMIRHWIRRLYSKNLQGQIQISECADTERFIEEAGNFFGKYEYRGTAEVTDVFCGGEHAYIAMEHLPGQNLRQYLHSRKKGQFTIEEAWELLFPVLELLSWMHSIGIVHGGITMERLLFDENGSSLSDRDWRLFPKKPETGRGRPLE